MTEQLLPYQLDHVERLVYSLTSYNRVLDLSGRKSLIYFLP